MARRTPLFSFLLLALAAFAALASAALADVTRPPVPYPTPGTTTESTSGAIQRRLLSMDAVTAGVGSGIMSGVANTIATGSIVQGVASGVSNGLQTGVYTAVTGYTPWQRDGSWFCGPTGSNVKCYWNAGDNQCYCTGYLG